MSSPLDVNVYFVAVVRISANTLSCDPSQYMSVDIIRVNEIELLFVEYSPPTPLQSVLAENVPSFLNVSLNA
jgi:hypothetical protein